MCGREIDRAYFSSGYVLCRCFIGSLISDGSGSSGGSSSSGGGSSTSFGSSCECYLFRFSVKDVSFR